MTHAKKRLGDLCTVRIGRTPRRDTPEYWGGAATWVTVRELNGGVLSTSKEQISELAVRDVMQEPIPAGTLLYSFKLSIGKMAIAGVPLYTNEAIAALVIRDASSLDRDYLRYALMACSSEDAANHAVLGKVLNKEKVEGIEIPVPALPEQRRIVDLLTRAEGIVRLRREAEKKAAELIPALFLSMFGDPATNPKGWHAVLVKDALAMPIRNGVSPSKLGAHGGAVLTLSAITHGRFDALAVKESMFAAPISSGDEVCEQDFLVCRGNGNPDLVGAGCFPSADMPGVAFPDTAIAARPSPNVFERAYFATAWATAHVRQQIKSLAKTTNGTYKINQTALGSIKLPAPPLDVQRRFGEQAKAIEGIRALQESARLGAQATFDVLLERTFSRHAKASV